MKGRNFLTRDPPTLQRLLERPAERFRYDEWGRPRVLWIEDDPHVLADGSGILQRSGFAVVGAQCGLEGLAVAGRVDGIILDLDLPGLDGVGVLRRLHHSYVRAPVMVLTAFADRLSLRDAMRLGARDFREKPIAPGELVTAVRELVERPRFRCALPIGAELIDVLQRIELWSIVEPTPVRRELLRVLERCLIEPAVPVPLFLAAGRLLMACLRARDTDPGALEQAVMNLERAAVQPDVMKGRTNPALLELVARLEHADPWSKPPSLRDVTANGFSWSTRELKRALHDETGVTVDEWRWCLRVRPALPALLQSRQYVGQIAFGARYEHQAAFNREFRKLFGLAPGQLRELMTS